MPLKWIISGVLITAAIAAVGFVGYLILAILAATGIERGMERAFVDPPARRAQERAFAARTPQWASDGQSIVINDDDRIYRVSTAGDALWSIPQKPDGLYFSPTLSSNNQVAYIRYREGRRSIERADANGRKVKTLAYLKHDTFSGPSWSPDGAYLAFATADNAVAIMKSNGSNRSVVAAPIAGPPIAISWSKDGQSLFILYERNTIIAVAADSSSQHTVARSLGAESKLSAPSLAPTGDRIYFAQSENIYAPTMLHSVTRQGSDLRTIAELGTGYAHNVHRHDIFGDLLRIGTAFDVDEIQISPDGSAILFAAILPDQADAVYLINSDGANLRQIIHNPDLRGSNAPIIHNPNLLAGNAMYEVRSLHVSWSPDGRRIAVHNADREKSVALYTIAPDGSDIKVLLRRDADGSLLPGYAAPFRP